MKKVIRNGKVGVLISPDYGLGWFSCNSYVEQCLFSPEIINFVEKKQHDKITEDFCKKLFDVDRFCVLGADDLIVEWIKEGEMFYIDEYDGAEQIITSEWLTIKA